MDKSTWDLMYDRIDISMIPWHSSNPEPILIELINDRTIKPCKVLDICCGGATNSIYLAEKGFDVTGIDFSYPAIMTAKSITKEKKVDCNFIVGDVLEKKINEKFGLIFDRGGFHQIPDKDKTKYINIVHDYLENEGFYFLQCFSEKNENIKKNLTKEKIKEYFEKLFGIIFIKDTVHIQPKTGKKIFFYTVLMKKK